MSLAHLLTFALLAQVPKAPPPPTDLDDAPARLAYMKASVAAYAVHPTGSSLPTFRLQAEPIFRLNNPVTGIKDGAIFLWLGEQDRPEAAVQVFRIPNGTWLHEFTSLSTAPFVAEVGAEAWWRPAKPGVALQLVPEAPKPAATPEARLRQLRAMAEEVAAEDNFQGKSWSPLRLLPKPLLRYGKPGTAIEDGALFAFVLGVDPEVFLMIESRPGAGGPEWSYAFAPMTSYELKASWKGRAIWSETWRNRAKDPAETFFDMDYSSERPAAPVNPFRLKKGGA